MNQDDIKQAKGQAVRLACQVLNQSRLNDATGIQTFSYAPDVRLKAAAVLAAFLSKEDPEKLAAAAANPAESAPVRTKRRRSELNRNSARTG